MSATAWRLVSITALSDIGLACMFIGALFAMVGGFMGMFSDEPFVLGFVRGGLGLWLLGVAMFVAGLTRYP